MKSVLCAAIIALTSQSALAVSPLPPGCTAAHDARCGGILGSSGGTCTCTVTTWTPRVVTNAKKGDLALVPLSAMTSPDDAAIRITMTALAQNFSHSLIHDSQGRVVHATAVGGVGQEGMHIDPADLMNATPGAVNTSIDWAFNNQRFSDEGLVGKPMSEVLRPMLENAADEATLNVGDAYYKVADFTDNTGMSFTFSADRTVNRRGTQCAGFVWDAFDRAGIHISRHAYPLDLRTDVANTLWAGIFDLAPWPKKHAIANQVVDRKSVV